MLEAYGLGVLVSYAFNNPKEFPSSKVFLGEESKMRRIEDPAEAQAFMRNLYAKGQT